MELNHSTSQTNETLKIIDDGSLPENSNSLQENECEKAIDMSLPSSEKVIPKNCNSSIEVSHHLYKDMKERSIFEKVMVNQESLSPERSSLPNSEKVIPKKCCNSSIEVSHHSYKDTKEKVIFEEVKVKQESLSPERSSSPESISHPEFTNHPEPINLSIRDRRSPEYYLRMLEQTVVVQPDDFNSESLDLSVRNRCSSFQEMLKRTMKERQERSSPKPIDMSFRERCDQFRKLLNVAVEIKQEKEDVDDLFCVDGITDSKEAEEKLNFERWKPQNFISMPNDFGNHDSGDDSKLFKCPTCCKSFLTKSRLTKHLLTHSEQCFRCSFCDFNTKRKDYLRVHEMNHLETKMFKCLKCNFGTNVRSRLKVHESIHAEEKSFKCFKCNYKTTRKDNLKLHELNHLDIKRFRCEHCEYGSNNKRNLKEHMFNHLELRLFKCPECPYETNKKGNLKTHQVKHVRAALALKDNVILQDNVI